ncbi:MAG: hypothetical protein LAO20_14880 [Acidobacteriia bacterium]|nr:hypothetical protein [Terriglobia bacterium]
MYLNNEIARKELAGIARGKKSRVPVPILARFVLEYCITPEVHAYDDSAPFLERLYSLEDTRPRF